MTLDAVRNVLGSLQLDPADATLWSRLTEALTAGTVGEHAHELDALLAHAAAHGPLADEPDARAQLLGARAGLPLGDTSRRDQFALERAAILADELLDDRAAVAALEGTGDATRALREGLAKRKERWKELVAEHRKLANDTAEPRTIAAHLVDAAVLTHQYRTKGRDKEVDGLLGQALAVDPGHARAARVLGRVLTKRERFDEAADVLERTASAVADTATKRALLVEAARLHATRRRDPVAAERAWREVLRTDPGDARANTALVLLLTEAGRVDDLARLYEDQLRLTGRESDVGLLVQLAMTHWRLRRDPGAAAPHFDRIARIDPAHPLVSAFRAENPPGPTPPNVAAPTETPAEKPVNRTETNPRLVAAVDHARELETNGAADRAADAWKAVLRLDAGNPDARSALRRLYVGSARWTNLVELLRQEVDALGGTKSTENDPPEARARKVALLREMAGVYRDQLAIEPMVVQTLNAIATITPDDREALMALTDSYERLGRHSDVIKTLERQVSVTTDARERAALFDRIAHTWLDRFNNVGNAARAFEQLLEVAPNDAAAIAELKDLYVKRRAFRPLLDVMRRETASLVGPARRDALVDMAKLASDRLAAPAESIGLWNEALALDPETPGALDALEKLTEREKDFAALANVLERRAAMAGDPDAQAAVLTKLGTVYADKLDDAARSRATWQRLLAVKPGHARATRVLREAYASAGDWDALERLYTDVGDDEGLVEVLGTAADKASDPATRIALSFRAAGVYETRLGNPARAFRSYERVLAADPANVRAATALLPIYTVDEKWTRLVQLHEVLLNAAGPGDTEVALAHLDTMREIASTRLADRAGALRWARRAWMLAPLDDRRREQLERAAGDANAWHEAVAAYDERAALTTDAVERAALRDHAAVVEADRLGSVETALTRYEGLDATTATRATVAQYERLLRSAGRFGALRDLLDARSRLSLDPGERRSLEHLAAKIERDSLGDSTRAAQRYERLLTDDPNDLAALDALAELATAEERWAELATLLERRLPLLDTTGAWAVTRELASLRLARLDDDAGAFDALATLPDEALRAPVAIELLERIVQRGRCGRAAAERLVRVTEPTGEPTRLAGALAALRSVTTDGAERRALGVRLANVYATDLVEPRRAFELLADVQRDEPRAFDVADAMLALAEPAGWLEELAALHARLSTDRSLPPEVRREHAVRGANLLDERLGRAAEAESLYETQVQFGSTDPAVFARLRALYEPAARWTALTHLFGTWAERSDDSTARRELRLEQAQIFDTRLNRPVDAIATLRQVLRDDAGDRAALASMSTLLERERMWDDLIAHLTRWIDADLDAATGLRFRRAGVLEHELHAHDRALDDYEAVLEADPTHSGARESIERFVSGRYDLRQRAARFLAERYEGELPARARDLVRMLLVRLEETTDGPSRAAIFHRVAELREGSLDDAHGAFDALGDAVSADPSDANLRAEFLRTAGITGQQRAAADLLVTALADSDDVGALNELAALLDEQLGDGARALTVQRRIVAAAGDDVPAILTAATALERLETAAGNVRGQIEALTLRARHEDDAPVRSALLARAAELYERDLNDAAAAVALHRQRAEIDPSDRAPLAMLARIDEARGEWKPLVETLRRDAELAESPAEQRAIQQRIARVLEHHLHDDAAAITAWRDLLDAHGADTEAHAALARLHEARGEWPALLDVLEQQLAESTDNDERAARSVRIATLRLAHSSDARGAVDGLVAVLEANPRDAAARSALTGLVDHADADIALTAARALVPAFENDAAWDKLVPVLDRIAQRSDDDAERQRSLARASELCETSLGDAARAYDFAAREFVLAPDEGDARARLDRLARLSQASGRTAAYVALLREVSPRVLDSDAQINAFATIATLAHTQLGDAPLAIEWYERILAERPDHDAALDALESIHSASGDDEALAGVLKRKIENASSDDGRNVLLHRLAVVHEERLGDLDAAIRDHESVLESGEDPVAARALERLYSAAGRWDDVTRLLESRLLVPGIEAVEVRHRLGVVALKHHEDADAALEHFREALALDATHGPTVVALEALGRQAGQGARVADVLAPVYAARMDWNRVIETIETRIAAETDPHERRVLLRRLGAVYEENLEDLDKAVDAYARVLREDVGDRSTWDVVARLARLLGRFDRHAEILASAIADVETDDDTSAELALTAARLYDEKAGDANRARPLYARAFKFDPTRRDVFDAYEALLARLEDAPARVVLFRGALAEATSADERRSLGKRLVDLLDGPASDPDGAIATLREMLDESPGDAAMTERLDSLLVRRERWRELVDLLDTRIDTATDNATRNALRLRRADVTASRLGDPSAAIDAIEPVLLETPADRAAVVALERLADEHPGLRVRIAETLEPVYRASDDWQKLIVALTVRNSAERDASARATFLREIAALKEERAGDAAAALTVYGQAFVADPGDGEVLLKVQSLAGQSSAWDDLVRIYEAAIAASDDAVIKAELLRAIAQTHDERREDPRAGIATYERLYALDPSQTDVLDHLRDLHELLAEWSGLVNVLERKAAQTLDDTERRSVLREIGEYRRDMLEDAPAAIAAYESVLAIDPGDEAALVALDELYGEVGDAARRETVLAQRLELATEPDDRRTLALALGEAREQRGGDPARAIDAYRAAREVEPNDPTALAALDRLYSATKANDDLLDVLRARLAGASLPAERVALRTRIARMHAADPDRSADAVDVWRDVFADDPENADAIAGLRELTLQSDVGLDAAAAVAPVLERMGRWDDLVAVTESRIALLDDAHERRDAWRELGVIHGAKRNDAGRAFAAYRRALHEDPGDADTLAALENQAGASAQTAALVEALESEAESVNEPHLARTLFARAADHAENGSLGAARTIALVRRAAEASEDDTILARLDRLTSATGDHEGLVEVLRRRARWAQDVEAADAIESRLADALLAQGDAAGALDAWRNLLDRSPGNRTARGGLERLAALPEWSAPALAALEQALLASDDIDGLAVLLSRRAAASTDRDERLGLLREIARLREERLGDPMGALGAFVKIAEGDVTDETVLAEIERLATAADAWEATRGVIERGIAAATTLDEHARAALHLRAARWYQDHLDDADAAETEARAALACDPESVDALGVIERVERAAGRTRDLSGTLFRRAALEVDPATKRALLLEVGSLAEGPLGDPAAAAHAYVTLLAHDESDPDVLERLTAVRDRQGRTADVAALLVRRAAVADDATAARLRREAAALYAGPLGDPGRAVDVWRELLEIDPTDRQARTALESLLVDQGRHAELAAALRARIEHGTDLDERNDARVRLATLLADRAGDTDGAIGALRDVLDEAPGHAGAADSLERLLTEHRRWPELLERLETRLQQAGDAGDGGAEIALLDRMGRLARDEMHDRDAAVAAYERIIERDPRLASAWLSLADLHSARGDHGAAVDALVAASSLDGATAAIPLRAAAIQSERLADADGAMVSLARALELEPGSREALARMKAISLARDDAAGLRTVLEHERTHATTPEEQLAALRALATLVRERQQDAEGSIEYLAAASALAPDDRDLAQLLADTLLSVGRATDAVPVIERVVASYGTKRTRDLAGWLHRLGQVHESAGDLPAALGQYDAAFKIDLTNVAILRDLALACYRTGDLERAQRTFRALLLQRLDDHASITKADVYYYLGDTLRQMGDVPKAVSMLERALETDRTHTRAADLLATLRRSPA